MLFMDALLEFSQAKSVINAKQVGRMVRPERIELPTSWFVAMHSIQLSYGRIVVKLCLRIITETKSFRPTSIAAYVQGKTPRRVRPLSFPAKCRTGCENRRPCGK